MFYISDNSSHLAAFGTGIALHLLVFRYGEWDGEALRIVGAFVAVQAAAVVYLVLLVPDPSFTLKATSSMLSGFALCVVAGIYTSMLVYRSCFHRLNPFPGPYMARLSNLYINFLAMEDLHLYEVVERLHKRYGDFIRLGPREISVNNPRAIAALHSAQSACSKGPWYDGLLPLVSVHTCRDKTEHSYRRKVWDRGFSMKSLRNYEPRVAKYTDQLLGQLQAREGIPLNVTDWFNFYSFDVMADLSFGSSFGMLQDGVKHYFMTSLHASMKMVGYFSHALWLFPIFKKIPILNQDYVQFWKWVENQVELRKKMNPELPDVFSWLLEDYESKDQPTHRDRMNLIGDAYLIVVAGSDTTAATLTGIFFELAALPDCLRKLQEELDHHFESEEIIDSISLSKLKYLNGVINEALRLHPPVPSGFQRVTPPEGLQIGDTFVPGDTIVQVPLHTLFRDERVFPQPAEFDPERWSGLPEMARDASVFIPFSTGPYGCVGKNLGLMEVRHVVSQIARRYDVAYAPGQTRENYLKAKVDGFTLACGPLHLVFTLRK